MSVADTYALVAIAFNEPERSAFVDAIERAGKVLVSTVALVEARILVHGRRGERGVILFDDLLRLPVFELVPPGAAEANAASAAFVAFGKGSGHPASPNFGGLFSYALAKMRGLKLLYKGDDFGHTDIEAALPAL